MLHDPKTFAETSSGPMPTDRILASEPSSNDEQDLREQDAALAAMLCHISLLLLSVWVWGIAGLVGWALMSTVLAGAWVLYTISGIRGVGDV